VKLPQKDPAPWITAHGVVAGKRLARFYNFLRDNNVAISDWSTDQSVDAEMSKLKKLELELMESWQDSPLPWCGDVLVDLRTLMRRGTSARVTEDNKATKKSEGEAKDQGDLGALEEFLKG
jgi:hypothetical protein